MLKLMLGLLGTVGLKPLFLIRFFSKGLEAPPPPLPLPLPTVGQLRHSPPSLLRLRTRIIAYAETAAQQQCNGSYEAKMSRKC